MRARTCARPGFIPQGRPRGVKRLGVIFEADLARLLPPGWVRGQWWEWSDGVGVLHWCQTDFHLANSARTVVLEAKRTWVPEARSKLRELYLPVAQAALARPAIGVVVVQRLTSDCRDRVCQTLEEAIELALEGVPTVWHVSLLGCKVPRPTRARRSKRPI